MPVDLDKSHWSAPGAVRTLRALWKLGGRATTRQIFVETDSMAVHSDVHSVRCFCQERGICDADVAVTAHPVGLSDRGKRVYLYVLDPAVMAALRHGLLDPFTDPDPPATKGSRSAHSPRATDHSPARRQAILFEAALPPYLKPH